jgi:hypothetical protein
MKSTRIVPLCSLSLVAACIAVWMATGREVFTRWPNARLEASDAPVSASEQDLLEEIGIDAAPPTDAAALESRFAFGLLPSGADPAHLASVATGLFAAATLSGVALAVARARRVTHT